VREVVDLVSRLEAVLRFGARRQKDAGVVDQNVEGVVPRGLFYNAEITGRKPA